MKFICSIIGLILLTVTNAYGLLDTLEVRRDTVNTQWGYTTGLTAAKCVDDTGTDTDSLRTSTANYTTRFELLKTDKITTADRIDSINVLVRTKMSGTGTNRDKINFVIKTDTSKGTAYLLTTTLTNTNVSKFATLAGRTGNITKAQLDSIFMYVKDSTESSARIHIITRMYVRAYYTAPTNTLTFIDSTQTSAKVRNAFIGTPDSAVIWIDTDNTFAGATRYAKSSHATPDTVIVTGLKSGVGYWVWFRIWDATLRDSDSIAVKTRMAANSLSWIDSTETSIKIRNAYTGTIDSAVTWYDTDNTFSGALRFTVDSHATPDTVNITGLTNNIPYWVWLRIWTSDFNDSDSILTKTKAIASLCPSSKKKKNLLIQGD